MPDDLVALCLDPSPDAIAAMLAVLKAGGACLPLDPSHPQERLSFMLQDAEARFLVTTQSLSDLIRETIPHRILLDADNEIIAAQSLTPPVAISQLHHLAYCIYTSGSTGKPKGVLLEHRNVVRLMKNDKFQFDFNADDVWTLFHSYCFDFSVWEMYGAVLYGGKLVIVPKETAKDPALFLDLLQRERVTILNQTPSAFYHLAQEALECGCPDLALRCVIFGGETLHPIQLKNWRETYPAVKLVNMYGITETTVHVTYKEIAEKEIAVDESNIGVPIPTTNVYVMDSQRRLLPAGVPGELWVGGDGVGRGYLHRDDLTREKFLANSYKPNERLYRSGDLAKWRPNGELVYLGRIDDQIQIRGFRVELGEIRSQLLQHPAVSEAEIVARNDRSQSLKLIAYIVPSAAFAAADLRRHLALALPDYMIPSAFVTLKAMPLTANGKGCL